MKYHISSRIIHWVMALIIIGLLALGFYMEDFLAKDAPNRMQIFGLHKSFGVVALIFIFLRTFNRFIQKTPKLPASLPKIEKFAAYFVHFSLYVLMFTMPISGYLMSNYYGYPVHLFSTQLPKVVATNYELGKFFGKTHSFLAWCIISLLILHILGALKHRFFDKAENDVLKRMI